ncbi:hypothetical protein B7494_g6523 [Chlorociboria aeruginascens]|nr:hypothetical protein B7494_g6523 [Chlorociboria aeruginascens]
MSQSKNAVELCALLVDEIYGELTSRIFTLLLRRGRLSTTILVAHTGLSRRQLRHGLTVLLQQNLIYYYHDRYTNITHYEANHDAAYALVRSGKIMEMVNNRHGPFARDIVKNLLILGHVKLSDLAKTFESSQTTHVSGHRNANTDQNHTNGLHKPHSTAEFLDSTLYLLLEAGLIEPISAMMFRSPTDMYNQVEQDIRRLHYGGNTKGNKQKEELKTKVRDRLQALRSDSPKWKSSNLKRAPNGHLLDEISNTSKRRKLVNGDGVSNNDHSYEDKGIRLDRDLVLRVNYEKCTVALRSMKLVEIVSDRIGKTTSHIYAEFLRLLEESILRCRLDPMIDGEPDPTDGPYISTKELAAALSPSINVAKGIGKTDQRSLDTAELEKKSKTKKRKTIEIEAEVEGEASSDEDESDYVNGNADIMDVNDDLGDDIDDPVAEPPAVKTAKRVVTFDGLSRDEINLFNTDRISQLKSHLMLLAGDDWKFLEKCGNDQHGQWKINFKELIEKVQHKELDAIVYENFGQTGHRLARIMRDKGKLDEKQLPTLALMRQKDVRTKLAEMQMAGMIDVQEVPRDTARLTSRAIFLWYFDTERVSSIVLDNIYKTMSRCYQRLAVEKRSMARVIALSERTDVKDIGEENTLEQTQLNQLWEFREKENDLLGQIGRLDELVGIFRDY